MFLEDLERSFDQTGQPIDTVDEARKVVIRMYRRREESDEETIRRLLKIAMASYGSDTHFEMLIAALRKDESDEVFGQDYTIIYALTKLKCSVSEILSRADFDSLISALDMNRRSMQYPSEWYKLLGITHSGDSLESHKMGINEFIDTVVYELDLVEDDLKPHSHSGTLNVLDQDENDS
jgi:hypothetical protein